MIRYGIFAPLTDSEQTHGGNTMALAVQCKYVSEIHSDPRYGIIRLGSLFGKNAQVRVSNLTHLGPFPTNFTTVNDALLVEEPNEEIASSLYPTLRWLVII